MALISSNFSHSIPFVSVGEAGDDFNLPVLRVNPIADEIHSVRCNEALFLIGLPAGQVGVSPEG
jgi:hypothetical protein